VYGHVSACTCTETNVPSAPFSNAMSTSHRRKCRAALKRQLSAPTPTSLSPPAGCMAHPAGQCCCCLLAMHCFHGHGSPYRQDLHQERSIHNDTTAAGIWTAATSVGVHTRFGNFVVRARARRRGAAFPKTRCVRCPASDVGCFIPNVDEMTAKLPEESDIGF
jgi:hypothetical protein